MHNRKKERALLKRKLEAGVSIHMPAPRRIGKTWTIARLADDLRGDGWQAIEMDVEGMRTSIEFASDLCKRIETHIPISSRWKAHFSKRIDNVLGGKWGDRPIDALGKIDPIEFAETLIAALDESSEKTAIIIDEIAYFFLGFAETSQQEARDFAYKLRALQQRYKKVRWLLTGSIGLDTIARRYGLAGAFVDFETFLLEPFTGAEARSYLRDPQIQQQLTHAFDASDADFDWMFEELGWLAPHYLQMVANEVRPSMPGKPGQISTAKQTDFEAAFGRLLQPNRQAAFAVWDEHISKNLPVPDRAVAKHLLNVLSRSTDGETENTLLVRAVEVQGSATKLQVREVLSVLLNDSLITKTGDRYTFRSGLIRRYWQEYQAQ